MRGKLATRREMLSVVGVGAVGFVGLGGYHAYGTQLPDSPTRAANTTPRIIGHRGAADLEPENTVRAIERAAEEGADGVEIDFRATRDGVLVALHDPVLDVQTTGTGMIANIPYDDLSDVRVQGSEPIPTIDDVLEAVREHDLHLFLEIKVDGITEQAMDAVRDHGWQDKTTVVSFESDHLSPAKSDGWETGLLGSVPTEALLDEALDGGYEYVLPHFVPHQFRTFSETAWGEDIVPGAWSLVTVEKELRESLLARPSVVITNRPDTAIQLRDELYG